MKNFTTKTVIVLCLVSLVAGAGLALAATTFFTQTISWQKATVDVAVTGNTTVNLGTIQLPKTHVETYGVSNNGNTAVTVYAHASGTGFTESWDKPSTTLNPGDSTTFTLTLTITDNGSCIVTFTDTA